MAGRAPGPVIAMECPDENVLGELSRGELDPSTRAQVEAHLHECEPCSDVVAELARIFASSFAEGPEVAEPEPEPDPSLDGMDSTLGDDHPEASPWSADLPLPEGAKLGRYVVLHAIGSGAMGIVYAAFDPQLDRKVALKLLRRGGAASLDPANSQSSRNKRLLREAQALARLSHPNAIPVHDVGTWEGQVFLAMEFVPDGTLTQWLRARPEPRPWRDVLRVFRQAGEGLAAAHDAGLVHRDFKPDNVLLHGSGRPVVTDFGLARPVGRSGDAPTCDGVTTMADSLRMSGSASALVETLTQTGALVGTPAYMAPEQLEGRRCDAQSDQFAFCVALYEGLYGERPFQARSLSGLIAAIAEQRIAPPPRGREVPRWLRRAVLRGLAVRPEDRHPDMHSLLSALRPRRLASRRIAGVLGLCSLAAGAGAVAMLRTPAVEPAAYCDDVDAKLIGVWDDALRTTTHEAFDQSGLPFAQDTAARVTAHLDGYAREWVEVQTEACRGEAEGREPEAVVTMRMTCLAQRRSMLGAMGRALSQADTDTVMQSISAVQTLPRPQECADVSALGHDLPPIPEAERDLVAAARSSMHEAQSLRSLGKLKQAHERSQQAAAAASALTYGPVRAEDKAGLADALQDIGDFEAAEAMMHEALHAALAVDHDRIVAEVATSLAYLEIARLGPSVTIERWARMGLAALQSQGGRHVALRANLLALVGHAQRTAGDLPQALETLHEALEIRQEYFGSDHYGLVEPLSGLGGAYARAGDLDSSVRYIEQARAIVLQTYGEQHPHYSVTLQEQGTTYFVSGYYAEALQMYQQSHRRFSQSLGARHPYTAVLGYNVATMLIMMERYDEALPVLTEAQSLEHELHGERSRVSASSWYLLAELHLRAGRVDAAIEASTTAIEIVEEVSPDDAARIANYRSQLGLAQLRAGRAQRAAELLEAALAVQREESSGPTVEVAETTGRLAMVYLAQGRLDEARAMIDTSVEQYEQADPDPHQHAEAWFRRARIRAAAGEPTAAREEAERARALYADRADQPSRLAAVEDWLAQLPS